MLSKYTKEQKSNLIWGIVVTVAIIVMLLLNGRYSYGQTVIDARDSQEYNIVTIGTQTWMAENLNYEIDSLSWCYMNDTAACTDYGRLYNWTVVDSVCMTGYHVPTDAEWRTLESYLGMDDDDISYFGYRESGSIGKALKATSTWSTGATGLDTYDFAVLAAGIRSYGAYKGMLYNSAFWTATEDIYKEYYAYSRMFYYGDGISRDTGTKANGYSIRCIKD